MRKLLVVAAVALMVAGCDSGPSGPGTYTARVQSPGPVLGGAVVEVVGKGVSSFSGSAGSRVFWAARSGMDDTYRVVVVRSGSGDLEFKVGVQDLGGSKPRATIINLVNGSDVPLPATNEYKVRFSR